MNTRTLKRGRVQVLLKVLRLLRHECANEAQEVRLAAEAMLWRLASELARLKRIRTPQALRLVDEMPHETNRAKGTRLMAERLLALAIMLQERRQLPVARVLARRFEVSTKTVYRDLEMLRDGRFNIPKLEAA